MKVKELMKELTKYDENAEIVLIHENDCNENIPVLDNLVKVTPNGGNGGPQLWAPGDYEQYIEEK